MAQAAIEASRLNQRFGEVQALNDLSLTVHKGELFCLVGPDGAGKSTVLKLLCGIIKPDSGTVRVLGHDLARDLAQLKPRIGYFAQGSGLYGDLTVDENIQFFAEIHRVRNFHSRREELLQFTRLTPFRTRLAERLSGGMKQKLALACTLVHAPELVLLDEPTAGVDPVSRRDLWVILSDLTRQGITVVMSTPYLDEAERGTRVAFISQGRLITSGTPEEVKAQMPGTLIEVVSPAVRQARDVLSRVPEVSEVQMFGDRLNVVVAGPEQELVVTQALRQAGVPTTTVRAVRPALENVFVSLLKAG